MTGEAVAVSGRAAGWVQADKPFSIETHGINPIPAADRHGHPRELFWVWLGANIVFTQVISGAIIVGFGLGFWPALAAVVVGNLFWVLVGIAAIAGPNAGTATLAVSRSAFGVLGNIPAALLSWITVVGWEAVNVVIGTLSLFSLLQLIGLPANDFLKAVCFAVVMLVSFSIAVLGHATIVVMNRILSILLAIGTVGLAILVLQQLNLSFAPGQLAADNTFAAWLLALLVMASIPFSWINYPADYTRYMPSSVSAKQIAFYTALGGIVPAVLISVVGVAAATSTDMSDPVAGLGKLIPAWFLGPYLAVVVGGTITNNFLNFYSSGMSLLSIGIRLARYKAVLIDAVIGGLMSVYALFIFNFVESFIQFLSFMVVWIAPWSAIYLTNMLLRRNRYEGLALHQKGGGVYWYSHGWNWRGLLALAAGIVSAALFANAPIWHGPLVRFIGGGDASIYVGFIVAAIVYLVLMRRQIAKQNGADRS